MNRVFADVVFLRSLSLARAPCLPPGARMMAMSTPWMAPPQQLLLEAMLCLGQAAALPR